MTNRTRSTWRGRDRNAGAAPALPGYGTEDQGHPANQSEPHFEKYQKGSPSEWGEDVHPYPYPEGNPPALPGYDVEDQDHPAHKRNPRIPKQALEDRMTRRATKCLVLARHMLGRTASENMITAQAADLMDLPDRSIEHSLKRLGGGFLASDDDMFFAGDDDDFDDDMFAFGDGFDDGFDDFDDGLGLDDGMGLDDGFDDFDDGMGLDDDFDDGMMARMHRLASENRRLRQRLADQNDPKGETLAPDPLTEEEERAEEKAVSKSASFFRRKGGQSDGFIVRSDWRGSRRLFAAIDQDGDGIITSREVAATLFDPSDELLADAEELLDDEVDMLTSCGEMVLAGEVPEAFKKQWEKNKGDDSDDDSDDKGGKEQWEKNKDDDDSDKTASEDEDEEDDSKESNAALVHHMKKKKKAGDDDEEEEETEDDETSKEAASYFQDGMDPMGMGVKPKLSSAERALLDEIFSTDVSKEASDDLDEILNPQPREASTGVRSLGHQTRTASSSKSMAEQLSGLWQSAPNVDKIFNNR